MISHLSKDIASEDLYSLNDELSRLKKELILDIAFKTKVETRNLKPRNLAKAVRDSDYDQVVIDCSDWLAGDKRSNFLGTQRTNMYFLALKLSTVMFANEHVTFGFNNQSLVDQVCQSDKAVLERVRLDDVMSPFKENDYQSALVIDIETMCLLLSCFLERDTIVWHKDTSLPKLISLNGALVDEQVVVLEGNSTFLELLEVYGKIDKEPYALILESSYGTLSTWEHIKLRQVSHNGQSNFGVVHVLEKSGQEDFLWKSFLAHYNCDRCLGCLNLRESVKHDEKHHKDLFTSKLYRELSKKEIKGSFECSLPDRFFSYIRGRHE